MAFSGNFIEVPIEKPIKRFGSKRVVTKYLNSEYLYNYLKAIVYDYTIL